jgi:cold shock CspA family protein
MHQGIVHRLRGAFLATLGLGLSVGLTATGGGCGNCDGAIRELELRSVEACDLDVCVADGGVYRVGPDVTVRIVGDGPDDEQDVLLGDAAISAKNFFMLDEAGQTVAATIGASAGGHSCRNGVNFGLTPDAPLPAGTYTVVLVLEDLAWPLAGGPTVQTHDGKDAFVRTLEVVADATP